MSSLSNELRQWVEKQWKNYSEGERTYASISVGEAIVVDRTKGVFLTNAHKVYLDFLKATLNATEQRVLSKKCESVMKQLSVDGAGVKRHWLKDGKNHSIQRRAVHFKVICDAV
jgi:hypothetical protein